MKTTLIIADELMHRLRVEAAEQGRTISELVEAALRLLLERRPAQAAAELPPLPVFDGGPYLVNVASRDALYEALESG
ncbi:MAG: ribbon-helix-helix protein, CopG family [Longimicrobiales bacterium]